MTTDLEQLIAERDAARAEVERMRPVVEAAVLLDDAKEERPFVSAHYVTAATGLDREVRTYRAGGA